MADSGAKPWLSRASTCKVRSGCITCKVRHVKCDEEKPACNNCQKLGRICGGYKALPVTLPNKVNSTKACNRSCSVQLGALLPHPTMMVFETDTQQAYFDFFLHHTSKKLSGNVASVIWTSIVPQACLINCSMRHIVVAIAALDRIAESEEPGYKIQPRTHCFGIMKHESEVHYNIALSQYQRAIKAMKYELATESSQNVRKALIFCLLTICFESYIGNHEAGNIQALAGNNLLWNWLQEARPPNAILPGSGILSPSPEILEDDLIHAFIRLRQRVGVAYIGNTYKMNDDVDQAIKYIPQEFSTLKDAKIFWEMVEGRIERSRIVADVTFSTVNCTPCCVFRSSKEMDPSVYSVIEEHFSIVRKWSLAFEAVLARSRTRAGKSDYLGATIIKMRSLIARSVCIGSICETELVYDKYYLDYAEIVALARSVLHNVCPTNRAEKLRFKFDISMLPTLLYVVIFCRRKSLRGEALAILEAYSCREGSWDNLMAVSIGRWVTDVEEVGCQESSVWIPESARVRVYSFLYSSLQRRGVLRYQTLENGKYAARMLKSVDLKW